MVCHDYCDCRFVLDRGKALSATSAAVSYNIHLLYSELKYGFNTSHPTDPMFSAFKSKIHLCKPSVVNIFLAYKYIFWCVYVT